MRTTIDLPDDLFRKARIATVERGTTLRHLVADALSRDLGLENPLEPGAKRIPFPIFQSKSPGSMEVTPADIRSMEDLR